ncbi:hypothetical protein TNIN_8001, partial [Trichonephila inaurata madagascariensis]
MTWNRILRTGYILDYRAIEEELYEDVKECSQPGHSHTSGYCE